jgi:hypothetical protein
MTTVELCAAHLPKFSQLVGKDPKGELRPPYFLQLLKNRETRKGIKQNGRTVGNGIKRKEKLNNKKNKGIEDRRTKFLKF